MEFEWDAAKHSRNLRERGIGFDDGARIFEGRVLDKRHDYGEGRFRAVGETAGDILHVASRGAAAFCGSSRCGTPPKGNGAVATSRITLDELKALPSLRDRAKVAATSEADIRQQMVEDGENPDEELAERDVISPWFIRKRLGLSQKAFAETLGIPVATLRNWEQNRVAMEPATVALMRILAKEPEAALRALRRRAA
jgi:putative transcriptional regulator